MIHLDVRDLPFDAHFYNINIDNATQKVRHERLTLIILGAQNFLFPYPVSEIVKVAEEVKAIVAYDASHSS